MSVGINVLVLEEADLTNALNMNYVEENLMCKAIDFIYENNKEYYDAQRKLYRAIAESEEDVDVITESFAEFFDSAKEIIKKFIDFIKSLIELFINQLHKIIKTKGYILKNKNYLMKFSSEHEFDYEGYEFTIFEHIPVTDPLRKFDNDFIGLNSNDDIEGFKANVTAAISAIEDSSDTMDTFRAQVLGATGGISEEDYSEALFQIFRNGEDSPSSLTCNTSTILDALRHIETYTKDINKAKSTRDKLIKDYNHLSKRIEEMVKRNKDKDLDRILIDVPDGKQMTHAYSADVMTLVDTFLKAKSSQVLNMSNAHALAFTAKLEAIKDCYRQDLRVSYKALDKLAKDTSVSRKDK